MEQQTQQVTLTVNVNQVNVIMNGVAKLPIEIGLETFKLLDQQIQQQLGQSGIPQGPLSNKVVQ